MFTTKGSLEAMGGEVQGTTLLTRPDVIAKRPATVQKMVNALVRANKFIVGSSGAELATMLPKEISGDLTLYAESFEHSREAFPPDSLVTRDGVARVIETMRAFGAIPAGMKMEPESLFDNKFVLKALGR
jgi:NitT/TauT family transport system substrate-binding protein